MKIIVAVVFVALGFSLTTAQECSEITENQLELVFLNAVLERLPEGTPEPTALDRLHEYNFNCLAPGCTRDTYRSLTVTANYSYTTTSRVINREVRQLDVKCVFGMDGQPEWESSPAFGSSLIANDNELIDLLLRGDTQESCASCNVLQASSDIYHCVGKTNFVHRSYTYIHTYIHTFTMNLHICFCDMTI